MNAPPEQECFRKSRNIQEVLVFLERGREERERNSNREEKSRAMINTARLAIIIVFQCLILCTWAASRCVGSRRRYQRGAEAWCLGRVSCSCCCAGGLLAVWRWAAQYARAAAGRIRYVSARPCHRMARSSCGPRSWLFSTRASARRK